jgi:hypothetical protein
MATKKKSKIIESADIAEMTKGWPRVVQGSHLTVKYFEDGRTELIWDDAALTQEVNDAILSVSKEDTKTTKLSKSKGIKQ